MALPVDETALDMVDDTVAKAKVALHPYRNTLRFALGAVAAFYGRHFVFSLLYAQVIRQAWPLLRKTIGEICAARLIPAAREASAVASHVLSRLSSLHNELKCARAAGNQHEVDVLEAELADLQQELLQLGGPATRSLLQAIDPDRLLKLAGNSFDALATAAALATSHGARKVGFAVNLGDRVCDAVEAALAPLIRRAVEMLRANSRALDDAVRTPTGNRYLEFGVRALCNWVGIALAFRFEELVFSASNALWGAELMVASAALAVHELRERAGGGDAHGRAGAHAAERALAQRGRHRAAAAAGGAAGGGGGGPLDLVASPLPSTALSLTCWALAGTGLYYQRVGKGSRPLPIHLRLVLFAPLLGESWLRGATFALRGLSAGRSV
jgi:hypothetical protein